MQRIATNTKATDKHGSGKHGFTNGNAAGLIRPTQVGATWFDDVQESICRAIEFVGFTLNASGHLDLARAIAHQIFLRRPRADGQNSTSWPTFQWHTTTDDLEATWVRAERTFAMKGVADNTSWDLGTAVNTRIPNESRGWIHTYAICIKTTDIDTWHQVELRSTYKKTGGVLSFNTTQVDASNSGVSVTWSLQSANGGPYLRAAIPSAGGATFNIFADMIVRPLTVGT